MWSGQSGPCHSRQTSGKEKAATSLVLSSKGVPWSGGPTWSYLCFIFKVLFRFVSTLTIKSPFANAPSFCAWLLNLHKPWLLIRPPRFQTFLDEHWGYWGEHPATMSYSQFCRDVTTFICLCFFVFFVRNLGSSWAFCSMRHRRGDLILSGDPGDPIRTLIKIEHIWRVLISSDYMVLWVLLFYYIIIYI